MSWTFKLSSATDGVSQETITIFDVVMSELYADLTADDPDASSLSMQVRTFNLIDTAVMRNLNPSDVDKLVCLKGMIIRTSAVVPDLQRGYFECLTCQAAEEVDIMNGRIQEPTSCKYCKASNSMELRHNRCLFKDKQLVRLQENPEDIPQGETPMTVNLCVFEDLVDAAKPGDRMEVTGIYRAQPIRTQSRTRTLKSVYKTYIDVIHFKRTEKSRLGDSSLSTDELQEDNRLEKEIEQRVSSNLSPSLPP